MNEETLKLIGNLANLCAKLNRKDFSAFFQIQGHVEHLQVYAYAGGWKEGAIRSFERTITLDLDGYLYEGEDSLQKEILEITEALQAASDNNELEKIKAKEEKLKAEHATYLKLKEKFEVIPAEGVLA